MFCDGLGEIGRFVGLGMSYAQVSPLPLVVRRSLSLIPRPEEVEKEPGFSRLHMQGWKQFYNPREESRIF